MCIMYICIHMTEVYIIFFNLNLTSIFFTVLINCSICNVQQYMGKTEIIEV